MNFSHVLSFSRNLNKTSIQEKDHEIIQTIYIDGDVNLTKRWKLASSLNYDFNTKSVTNARITITRNLHCWNLSFFTTPIGTNKSFLLQLVANGKLLQDAKLEFRKPPSVF
jgi:lipopolysaccharide assembly outer membrane protein LptD (OstA)